MSSIIDAETLLAVDIGNVNTRANLFDVVEGRYRLFTTGRAPSTAGYPIFDVGEGVRMALEQVEEITGRQLLDETESLIMPVTNAGNGVDLFVATSSAGPPISTVMVGLMPGVSLESVRRLAVSSYLKIVEEIGLMDRRREEERIDLIVKARPDLILIAGGTDGGASVSVLQQIDTVALATQLLTAGSAPKVIFAGNRRLSAAVSERFNERAEVKLAPNIRPRLGQEDLGPAREAVSQAISEIRAPHVSGFEELEQWSGESYMLTCNAFGRVVRYLSQIYGPEKGVLGLDVGASQVTLGAAFQGSLQLSVFSDLGLGASLPGLLKHSSLEEIMGWLPIQIPPDFIQDYIYNKSLNPGTIATEEEEVLLEYVLARELIRTALQRSKDSWPERRDGYRGWPLPPLEPIMASGAVLARTTRPGFVAMILLDAIQPVGITTLVLDPHNIAPALGAAAKALPILTVQVLESNNFVGLGTVVAPVGRARLGRRVMRVRLEVEGGEREMAGEVRMGQLVVLPLAQGEQGRLTLRPERGIDVGFGGPGRAGTLRVAGGAVGLMIDARGRPLQFPRDAGRRRELNQKWLWDIGAME
jgi:hypothetical protein